MLKNCHDAVTGRANSNSISDGTGAQTKVARYSRSEPFFVICARRRVGRFSVWAHLSDAYRVDGAGMRITRMTATAGD
jgi:hypothetical protein